MSDQPQTPSDNVSSPQEPGAAASPTPPPAAAPPASAAGPAAMTDKDAHQWAMFCHLSALAMFLGIPFANILGPLIFWLIKKDAHPFIDEHGKEAVNFQISVSIYAAAGMVICMLLTIIIIGFFLMFLLIAGVIALEAIGIIKASMAANKGEKYEYPMTIRFIK